jgi:hypothetical protein
MAHYVSTDIPRGSTRSFYGGPRRQYGFRGLGGFDDAQQGEFSFESEPLEFDPGERLSFVPPGMPTRARPRKRRKCKPGRVKSCKVQTMTLRNGKKVRRRVCRDAAGLIVSNRAAGSRKGRRKKKNRK